jgi:hypothetical protein
MGPEMEQQLQGRIDLYLSDKQAELGINLDSMIVVQTGECHVISLHKQTWCCARPIVQSSGHVTR